MPTSLRFSRARAATWSTVSNTKGRGANESSTVPAGESSTVLADENRRDLLGVKNRRARFRAVKYLSTNRGFRQNSLAQLAATHALRREVLRRERERQTATADAARGRVVRLLLAPMTSVRAQKVNAKSLSYGYCVRRYRGISAISAASSATNRFGSKSRISVEASAALPLAARTAAWTASADGVSAPRETWMLE